MDSLFTLIVGMLGGGGGVKIIGYVLDYLKNRNSNKLSQSKELIQWSEEMMGKNIKLKQTVDVLTDKISEWKAYSYQLERVIKGLGQKVDVSKRPNKEDKE